MVNFPNKTSFIVINFLTSSSLACNEDACLPTISTRWRTVSSSLSRTERSLEVSAVAVSPLRYLSPSPVKSHLRFTPNKRLITSNFVVSGFFFFFNQLEIVVADICKAFATLYFVYPCSSITFCNLSENDIPLYLELL